MKKNILVAGVLGGVVMFLAMVAGRILLPVNELRSIPDQVQIHAALKERITEPGTYVFPYMAPGDRNSRFPNYLNEPVFAVTYNGYTHATVPGFASVGILSFVLAPIAAAWLLSQASARMLATYFRRVLFVAALGFFLAVSADLLRSLTDEQPFSAVAEMGVATLVTWILVGLVLAWRIKPETIGADRSKEPQA